MILDRLARNARTYRILLRLHRWVPPIEGLLRRATGGRVTLMGLAGIPAIDVIVPGRKSGHLRTTTLQYVSDEGRLLVVGSNWASRAHPAWSANLLAAQQVDVRSGGHQFRAEVTPLTGHERDRAWHTILTHWPNYRIAQNRVPDRPFRIFALTRIT